MRRNRSAVKHDAPLRMPRRKRGASPASSRISAASAATRWSISLALNAFVILLNGDLVTIGGLVRHFEQLGNFDTGDPGNRSLPDDEWDAIPGRCRNFTINQQILQLFVVRHPERPEPVALAAVADGEVGEGAGGELDELVAGLPVCSVDADSGCDFRDVDLGAGVDLDFELWRRLVAASAAENDLIALLQQLERFRHRGAFGREGEPGQIGGGDIAGVGIEPADVTQQ